MSAPDLNELAKHTSPGLAERMLSELEEPNQSTTRKLNELRFVIGKTPTLTELTDALNELFGISIEDLRRVRGGFLIKIADPYLFKNIHFLHSDEKQFHICTCCVWLDHSEAIRYAENITQLSSIAQLLNEAIEREALVQAP